MSGLPVEQPQPPQPIRELAAIFTPSGATITERNLVQLRMRLASSPITAANAPQFIEEVVATGITPLSRENMGREFSDTKWAELLATPQSLKIRLFEAAAASNTTLLHYLIQEARARGASVPTRDVGRLLLASTQSAAAHNQTMLDLETADADFPSESEAVQERREIKRYHDLRLDIMRTAVGYLPEETAPTETT